MGKIGSAHRLGDGDRRQTWRQQSYTTMEEEFYTDLVCINCCDDGGAMVLISVNTEGRIRVSICPYPIVESLKHHYTSMQYWDSIGEPLLMWIGSCRVSRQTFLFLILPVNS